MFVLDALMDGSLTRDYGNAAICAIFAILLVFLVLGVIILITDLVNRIIVKFDKPVEVVNENSDVDDSFRKVNENDDDEMAAVLTATIDYRNEIKEDVKVIGIKEIK